MRKLMWFTIGFTAACVAGVYLVSGQWLWLLGGFCLIAMLSGLYIKSKYGKIVACAMFGCVVGFLWLFGVDRLYLQPVRQMDGQATILTIEVTD